MNIYIHRGASKHNRTTDCDCQHAKDGYFSSAIKSAALAAKTAGEQKRVNLQLPYTSSARWANISFRLSKKTYYAEGFSHGNVTVSLGNVSDPNIDLFAEKVESKFASNQKHDPT